MTEPEETTIRAALSAAASSRELLTGVRDMASAGRCLDRADKRPGDRDRVLAREAVLQHGVHAAARLGLQAAWARADAAEAAADGDRVRAAQRTAAAERLERAAKIDREWEAGR